MLTSTTYKRIQDGKSQIPQNPWSKNLLALAACICFLKHRLKSDKSKASSQKSTTQMELITPC